MSPENSKRVQSAVKEAGAHLEGRLPPHPSLAKRNPYAHLWERIKATMGASYKDCTDAQVDEILRLVQWYRDNPC
jgi:hypothetical protein